MCGETAHSDMIAKKEKNIMMKYERADRITEILQRCKYATVEQLVKELHYSPATIRRDITYLESIGMVKKSYGGVCINEISKPVIIREHENMDAKIRICKAAEALIQPHDAVFIDGSTTTYFMSEFLDPQKEMVVTTSNLKLAFQLEEKGIECYVTGGKVVDTNMLTGTYAVDTVSKMNFDICFFSAEGISEEGTVCDKGELFADLRRTVIKRSRRAVCLCDSKKLGASSFLHLVGLEELDCVISDGEFPGIWTERFGDTKFVTAG